MGVRTAERMTGVSTAMATLQETGKQYYSAMGKSTLRREEQEGGANSALRAKRLVCGGSGGSVLAFVGAGTVKTGDGNPQQAVVHRELRTMMNVMIHHHAANARRARHRENFLAAGEQFPSLHHFRIAYFRQCRARLCNVLVKLREEFLSVGDFRRLEA